jgi:glycosyltransferase involved in cell wall biosynthesis
VGRVAYEKGFDLLLKAFRIVRDNNDDVVLYIIGDYNYDKSYYRSLCDLIKILELDDCVYFVGYTNNPYVYMKNGDCFVLSSRKEGLPNVLIEALYCGMPCAAFNCIPVVERIIDSGVTGYIAEDGNYEKLANAMMKCRGLGKVESSYIGCSENQILDLFK